MAPLSLTRLTKYYGATLGVEDITFDIQPGQVMGFVGPNGSRKTTVIRMLTGLIGITRGDAHMMGARVGIDNPEARRHLGYLPGSLGLYDNLTGRRAEITYEFDNMHIKIPSGILTLCGLGTPAYTLQRL